MPSSQKRVFAHAINDHALFFQSAFALHETGSLPEKDYAPYLTWFASHLVTPGGALWWQETRGFYNLAMIEALDTKIAEGNLPGVLELGFFALDVGDEGTAPRSKS